MVVASFGAELQQPVYQAPTLDPCQPIRMRRGHQPVSLKHIMADKDVVLEGQLKYRDGKKWKSRWCVIRKLSPVADKTEGDTPNQDRLHLYLYKEFCDKYKDVGDKHKSESAKLHIPLQEFYGIESGFVLDKEHHVMAVLCHKEAIVLAFSTRETLIQWEIRIRTHLGQEQTFPVKLVKCPSGCRINTGSVRLYIQGSKLCITAGLPPKLLAAWSISDLRKFGLLDGKFCFDAGTKCGKCAGAYVFVTEQGAEITEILQQISQGRVARSRRNSFHRRSQHSRYSMVTSPTRPPSTHAKDFTDCQVYADLNFMREEIPRSRTSSSVQPSSSTEYSSSPENPVLIRTQSLGNSHSPLRHIRSLTLKSERLLRTRSSSDSPDPNRRTSKGSPKKSRKRESGLASAPEDSVPGTSPEEVVSAIQKSVDALSPKLCSKRKSNSTGSSPADSPALYRRNSQTCVFASHGQSTRNSLELLDEVLKNCNVEEFSNSSSQSAGSSIKDLQVNSIRSSVCSVGSIAGTSKGNSTPSEEMKTKLDFIMSRKDSPASRSTTNNNGNTSQTTSPTAMPALPEKTKTRRRSETFSKTTASKPLEYKDLSRFDGREKESDSCWVKSVPVHSKSSSNLKSAAKQSTINHQASTIHNSLKRTKSCISNVSSGLSGSRSNGIDSACNTLAVRRRQSLEGFLEEPSVSTVTIPRDISVPKLQSSEVNPYCSLPPKMVKRPGNNVQLNSIPPVSCSVFVSSSNQGTAPSPSLVTPIPSTTEYLVMSGTGTPTSSQPKPATSDSGYIQMSHNGPATKSSSMPPYVNIAAYMELIQNIIRPKMPDYVNVPPGTGPIREEEPPPVKVTTAGTEYINMSSTKPSYSIACCKCSCPNPPVPDYVNISSILPGTGVEHTHYHRSSSPVVIKNNKGTTSHRSSPIPDYINIGPWLTRPTENIYANMNPKDRSPGNPSPLSDTEIKNINRGTLNGHPPLSSDVQPDGVASQPLPDGPNLPPGGESTTDLAYIARRHPNNTDDYMFITPGGRSSDMSTTVSPSSDYLSSLPLSPRSVFSTSSGSTSPRPYASPTPDYMMIGFDSDKDQKDGDGPVFSQVQLPPIRRVNSMISPSEILSRSRNLSISGSDSGHQSMSSYMEMKPPSATLGRKRIGKFIRSRSLKESTHHPRPQLMHSHSVDQEFEVSTYIVADIGTSPTNTHSDYMCMTPPGDDDDVVKSICDNDVKPIKPFDNLIEPRHYVGSKVTIPTKSVQNAVPEVKNSPDTKPEQPKSLLSRIIRRNSTKDRKSILKTPDDSLSSPIESVAEVQEDKPVVVHSKDGFPFSGDPFGLLGPPKGGGDASRQSRSIKHWPEDCNLTDEEKQSYSGLTPESPPALPLRKYKHMTESPAYMLKTPGGMMKNDHTASSSTLQPDDDDDSTSQIYIPSDEEEDVEDLPPDLPEKTRVYSAVGRIEGNDDGFEGTRGRTLSSSSDNMLTDDLKFRSQTASPRMTLPRAKRETRLTIFVPRSAEMDDDVWLTKSASNTTDVGDAGGDAGSIIDADVSDTTSVCSYGSFSDSQSVYSDELNPRNTSTCHKPRFGLEYRRLDRRILENEPQTPNSPSVASSVFTFDASRLSSISALSIGTHSPHSPSILRCQEHDYINIGGPRSFTDSPRFYHSTPPGSPRSLSGISEISSPSLNYAEIDLSQPEDKRPKKAPSRASDIEYAELDMLATAAASRAGKEHAQLREDSLRRKDRRTPLEDGSMEYIQRRHRKTSSSHTKERKSSSSRSGSKDRKFSSPM